MDAKITITIKNVDQWDELVEKTIPHMEEYIKDGIEEYLNGNMGVDSVNVLVE